jgi:hypothetical protein
MVPQKVSTLVILQTPGMVQTCGPPDPSQSNFSLFPKFPKGPHTVYIFAAFTFLTILNLNHTFLNYYNVLQQYIQISTQEYCYIFFKSIKIFKICTVTATEFRQ